MMDMKRLLISVLLLALLLTLAGCGVRQEPLETWPIVYNYNTISCYTRDYETIGDMLEEEHIIFHGRAVRLVDDSGHGVRLELEAIDSTAPEGSNIFLLQNKDPNVVLKKGEEVVLILFPGSAEGLYHIPNGKLGAFRIDQESGQVYCPRMESLLKSAPEKYAGKKMTLEQVYDILVELDKAE